VNNQAELSKTGAKLAYSARCLHARHDYRSRHSWTHTRSERMNSMLPYAVKPRTRR